MNDLKMYMLAKDLFEESCLKCKSFKCAVHTDKITPHRTWIQSIIRDIRSEPNSWLSTKEKQTKKFICFRDKEEE